MEEGSLVEVFALTDRGRVREKNEDRVCLGGEVLKEGSKDLTGKLPVFLGVCDGVGGHPGGEEAAELALTVLSKVPVETLVGEEELKEKIIEVNRLLLEKKKDLEGEGMYTTIAALVLSDQGVVLAHLGDSRIYRLRGGFLSKLTTDHSLAQSLVDQGLYGDVEEAKRMVGGGIDRCLGQEDLTEPEIRVLPAPKKGDVYLACTDGLWQGLSLEEMEEVLLRGEDLSGMAQELSELAQSRDGSDNLTLCLARVL